MKNTIILSVALVSILASACCQNSADNKGKLFIIGGGEKTEEMLRSLVSLAKTGDEDYMYILPMASSVPDSAVIWAKEDFKNSGIRKIVWHNFRSGEIPSQSSLDSIRNARLIFITGGDQSRFMSVVRNTPIMSAVSQAYKNGSVIAGTSAGAAVMSRKMITGNQKKHPDAEAGFVTIESDNVEITEGLGLLQDVIIDQHFIKRQRLNRLIAVSIENPGQLCVGIDESTAIIVDGDMATVTGNSQVVVIKNTKGVKSVKNGLLGISGLKLNVYVPGQSFKLR